MPTILAGTSQALPGHCCATLPSQQGMLGNGMQHDAFPPSGLPRVS